MNASTNLPRTARMIFFLAVFFPGFTLIFQPSVVEQDTSAHNTRPPGVIDVGFHPQSSQSILLSEDFEDGQAQGWGYNPAEWQIITDNITSSHAWTTIPAGDTYAATGSLAWTDYRFQLQARRLNSNANLYFRLAANNGYAIRLESSRIVLWTERSGSPQELTSASISVGTGWHDYAIVAAGAQITVTVDSSLALVYTDGGPASLSGGIALEAFANDGARFDNLQVTSLLPEQEQLPPWVQTNGPLGGVINTIEIHPANPDTIFAAGVGGRVYKSTNGGASWTGLAQVVQPEIPIYDLLIHPAMPQTMYVLAGRLYKSDNGGESWAALANDRVFNCVAMDPANPSRLLAGTPEGDILLSLNGGATWDDFTANLPGYWIKDVAFGKGSELWAGTGIRSGVGNGLLYHSANGGASWSAVDLGQAATSEIHTIFVDSQNRDIIYVGLRNIYNTMFNPQTGIYLVKTNNGGLNWMPLRLPSTDAMINIAGRVSYDASLYVFSGGRAMSSSDGGQTWGNISPPGRNGDMYDIAVDPRNTGVLYLPRRAFGMLKSTDQGGSWTPINEGLLNTTVSLLALGNPSGSTLYAASTSGEGTYKSTDYGSTWVNVTAGGITHPWADELVVSPTNPNTIWQVADVGEVFVSTNSGSTWTKTIDPYGAGFRAGTVSAAAIAPSDPDVVYTLKSGFGIFKSPNGGQGWDFLHQSEVDYTYSLAVHPSNPDIVYSGYSPKPFQDWAMVRRSTDGGLSWSTVLSVTHSSGITSVAIDPQNPNTVYSASTGRSNEGGGQVYRSADSGDHWTQLNPHFTMLTVWGQPQLTGDPAQPSTAYAATWLGGTWKTTDAGQNWALLDGAPQSSTALSLDPADPGVVYAADRTAPRVWKSADAGETWSVVADFASTGAFLVNRVLAAPGAVYASTFGPGIHDGKLFRSTNGGAAWEDITNGLPRSVLDIAVDPSNAQVIVVTTHIHGAYKSTNGGATWSELLNFPDIGGYDIELDPKAPMVIYAAGLGATTVPDWVLPGGYTFTDSAGVYRSKDGGATWSQLLETTNECRAIRIHPANPNLLFASALSDGFFVSADGGSTWSNPTAGLDSLNLTSAWVAGNKIYAGTQGFGVYAGDVNTVTGALAWSAARSNKPIPDVHNLQVQVDPANSNRLYVGANPGGLFRSDDGGSTWYDKNFQTPSVVVDDPQRQGYYTFAINPADPNEVWVGTWGKGIYKSYDGQDFNIGANGSNRVMYGKFVNALMFHPTLGVIAATEQGVFHTTDGGLTWAEWSTGLATPQARTLGMYPDGSVLCGTAGYELYVREPSGSQWTQLTAFGNFGTFWPIWNNRPLYQYSQLLFHPTDPNTIYFGTFPAGIFKSLDGGATWRENNVGWTNDGVFTLVFHPQDTNTVYAGTYNGLNRSLDAGAHWEKWDAGWPGEQWVFSIAFDPRNPDVMYACSKNGENEGVGRPDFHGTVMKSLDGGASWFAVTNGLDVSNEFYKIIVDKHDPDTLYLATQREGVFVSHDGAAHWQPFNDGLTSLVAGTNGNNVTNTMALSSNGLYLYFGSAGSGVFRRLTVHLDHHVYLPLVTR